MKRAQIEMMGLVIVVILVTIGMFFSISFQQPKTEKPPLAVFSDEQMASNFLISLLDTNIPGRDIKVHDVAIDCVRLNTPSSIPSYSFPGFDSCTKLENITETILLDTLDAWAYEYHLTYRYTDGGGTQKTLMEFQVGCGPSAPRSAPGFQPISLFRVTTGTAIMQLDICTSNTP